MGALENVNRGKKIVVNLFVNWLIPLVLYMLLNHLVADSIALGISGMVPAFRTIILWLLRRRIDWIGLTSVFGFSFAIFLSIFMGGDEH